MNRKYDTGKRDDITYSDFTLAMFGINGTRLRARLIINLLDTNFRVESREAEMRFVSLPSECEANLFESTAMSPIGVRTREDGSCYVVTAQGQEVNVTVGDWIILENPPGDGTRAYPCKADVFERRWATMLAAHEEQHHRQRFTGAAEVEGTRESLLQVARMLDPDLYPANKYGQITFARSMMESAAAEIRAFLINN